MLGKTHWQWKEKGVILSPLETLLWNALVDFRNDQGWAEEACRCHKGEEEPGTYTQDEWFRCTTREMTENFGLTSKQQNRVLRSLKDKGCLKIKRIGLPAVRFLSLESARRRKAVRR